MVFRHPILGADFLHRFNLFVDMTWGCLIDSLTQLQINGMLTEGISPSPCVCHPSAGDSFSALLQEFPAFNSPIPKDGSVQHEVVHHITTTGPPVHA